MFRTRLAAAAAAAAACAILPLLGANASATTLRSMSATIVTPYRVVYPARTAISGVVTDAITHAPIAGARVQVWAEPVPTTTFVVQYTTYTASNGSYTASTFISASTYYYATVSAPNYASAKTATTKVLYYPGIAITKYTNPVHRGVTLFVSGGEYPSINELPAIQVLDTTGWHSVVKAYFVSSSGVWSAKWVVPTTRHAGNTLIRAILPADPHNEQGTSGARTVSIT
ncbi:MAG: carboxypeptidase-like regulatory domain-containing protein [Actinomycetota bacterium]|nr:carboxypeptidase-like regulatory domain-containing protein [Actinomycetota bacterium]